MKLPIPNDWNGEDWIGRCVYWPDSISWQAILRGFLSYATRGRVWDERSGSILDVQSIGWDIWDRNKIFVGCDIECPDDDDDNDDDAMLGGSLIVEDEEMGQVVTDVQVINGTIRVFFGPCCYKDLAGSFGGGGLTIDDPIPPDQWGEGSFYPCGKLTAIMDTIWNIGSSCWSQKGASPLGWVGEVRGDVPGFNLNTAYIVSAIIQAGIIDATYGESEVFDTAIWAQAKCAFVGQLSTEEDGISSEQFINLMGVIATTFASEGRLQAGAWWTMVASVLGWSEANKAAILGAQDDVSECDCADAIPPGELGPDASGWYLGVPLTIMQYGDGGLRCMATQGLVAHDVYGAFFRVLSDQAGTVKRMLCSNTGGSLHLNFLDVTTSITGTSSDHLENLNQTLPFIQMNDSAICASMAALRGFPSGTKLTGGVDSPVIASPECLADEFAGFRIDYEDDNTVMELLELRYIHNINSPSHA